MRDLKFTDVFTVIRIIKKAGISEQARAIFKDINKETTEKELGARFLFACVENLSDAEKEITEFLASLKEVEVDEIKKLNMTKTTEMFMELGNQPDLKSFLSSVSHLMK